MVLEIGSVITVNFKDFEIEEFKNSQLDFPINLKFTGRCFYFDDFTDVLSFLYNVSSKNTFGYIGQEQVFDTFLKIKEAIPHATREYRGITIMTNLNLI